MRKLFITFISFNSRYNFDIFLSNLKFNFKIKQKSKYVENLILLQIIIRQIIAQIASLIILLELPQIITKIVS